MSDKLRARVLRKTIPNTQLTIASDNTYTLIQSEGWQTLGIAMGGAGADDLVLLAHIGYFDLSGYTLKHQTVYPQAVSFQDMGLGPAGGPAGYVERVTVVSTTPLTMESLSALSPGTFRWAPPGTPASNYDLSQIISARYQLYFVAGDGAGGITLMKESTYGAGDSTAADKLYYADAYVLPLNDTDQLCMVPDSGIVIPSLIGTEDDLEYIMRLSRSVNEGSQ